MKDEKNGTENLMEEIKKLGGISSIILNYIGLSNFSITDSASILSKYGWYLPANFEVKKIRELVLLLDSNKVSEAEKQIVDFLKSNLKKIEVELISKHLERKDVIKEAFEAHKSKMFYSSTILFISIADGITETNMYIRTKNFNAKINPGANPEIIKILSEESPLNKDTRTEANPNFFSELNRHSVMHGLSFDYGTEINSLKAISLMCFVNDWYNRYK